jgi:formylglycine-generating enzyme required for sulfatase activity
MVLITAGGFNMGDTAWIDSAPVHVVHLDAFYIDKYEVTFDQYDAFCTATSRTPASDQGYGRGTRPVINITWDDSKAYCEWAGKRLPTEAEWEGACRAGTNTAFYWGDDPGYTLMGNYAWTTNNSPLSTQPVGGKLANAFGLYDMSGNVWEWVADRYDSGYYAVSPLNNPTGPASGTKRVMRGGAFDISGSNYGDYLRSGYRNNTIPANSGYWQGCRCAKTP